MTESSQERTPASRSTCSTTFPAAWPYDELLPRQPGLLVVLSGPSAVGKDAVIDALRSQGFPFTKIVTATTRAPRAGERPGQDYHFLSVDDFTSWREAGKFLEWANVYGTPYGTPIEDVRLALAAGETVLLKIDVQGAVQVRRQAPEAVYIFLGPGSFDEIRQRLQRRGTETDEQYQHRVTEAREELLQLPEYDYLVVNRQDELDCAVEHVKAIITAERLRVHPRLIPLR